MLVEGTYPSVLVRVGRHFQDGDLTERKRIKGPVDLIGSARTFESARSDTDRGHSRVLLRRGEEYFIAGVRFTEWAGESNNFYLHGPLAHNQVCHGFQDVQPDVALLNSANLAPISEL